MSLYFDHNATTPLDERVLETMLPWLREGYANAASLHRGGREARAAIDHAREQVAALAGAHPGQVVFTAGGTEADNLAVKGLAARLPRGRVLVGSMEHPAVLEAAQALAPHGWQVDEIPAGADGRYDLTGLREQLAAGDVRLVAAMAANNETGALQDTAAIAEAAREAGALFHCDAVQLAGKGMLRYPETGAHTLALSAHKIYGPKGVGALILDKGVDIEPQLHGGGHEGGLRAGTENTAGIVGFGAAAELAAAELEERYAGLLTLRDRLEGGLSGMPGVTVFAEHVARLPNTVQFAVPGYEGEGLLMSLDRHGIAVSSGSACASGRGEPSHVLLAMGIDPTVAYGAVRVSLGRDNSAEDVDSFLATLRELTSAGAAMPSLNPAVLAG
ncbi:cysteine desulfurase [Salinisphaera sp. PC39]|uniref:cysteine desulfurase family protein n=1 Tax=Salinisphaera sp. PC39 TaxID=1304156 RepID=UPI00333F1D6A